MTKIKNPIRAMNFTNEELYCIKQEADQSEDLGIFYDVFDREEYKQTGQLNLIDPAYFRDLKTWAGTRVQLKKFEKWAKLNDKDGLKDFIQSLYDLTYTDLLTMDELQMLILRRVPQYVVTLEQKTRRDLENFLHLLAIQHARLTPYTVKDALDNKGFNTRLSFEDTPKGYKILKTVISVNDDDEIHSVTYVRGGDDDLSFLYDNRNGRHYINELLVDITKGGY